MIIYVHDCMTYYINRGRAHERRAHGRAVHERAVRERSLCYISFTDGTLTGYNGIRGI